MNVDLLRFIDRWIGCPLCWLLTFLRFLARPFPARSPSGPPRKILVIKFSEMGSTVLAYSALTQLKRHFDPVELYFLVFAENRAILTALGLAREENIVSVRATNLANLVTDGVRAIWRLRKEGLDATIDMDFFSRSSAIVAFLVCRHHRVGFHRYTNEGLGRGNLLTHPVLYSAQVHTSIAFLALARALMEPRKPLPLYKASLTISEEDLPTYRPSAELIRAVRQAMTSAGLPELRGSSKLILVNPNSSDLFPLRRWPMPYFVEFCQRLLQARPGASIVVTGSASEIPDADQIVKQASHPRCVSLAGKTSFPELLALHSIADLLITNDSGPAHFASLVRLPTIALFGPETPQLYKPLGNACIALYAGFACSPCVSAYNNKKSPCTDNRCLQAITPQTVLLEALKVLDGGSVNR